MCAFTKNEENWNLRTNFYKGISTVKLNCANLNKIKIEKIWI